MMLNDIEDFKTDDQLNEFIINERKNSHFSLKFLREFRKIATTVSDPRFDIVKQKVITALENELARMQLMQSTYISIVQDADSIYTFQKVQRLIDVLFKDKEFKNAEELDEHMMFLLRSYDHAKYMGLLENIDSDCLDE